MHTSRLGVTLATPHSDKHYINLEWFAKQTKQSETLMQPTILSVL